MTLLLHFELEELAESQEPVLKLFVTLAGFHTPPDPYLPLLRKILAALKSSKTARSARTWGLAGSNKGEGLGLSITCFHMCD